MTWHRIDDPENPAPKDGTDSVRWQRVDGWSGYEVSDCGQIRSRRGVMRPFKNDKGYLVVRLSDGTRRKMARVHRLVAVAFVPNPNGFPEVNHLDGDKANPSASNLEWTTPLGNRLHARDSGLLKYAKLSPKVIAQARALVASGASRRKIARELGLGSHTTIAQALSGRTWATLPNPPEKERT